jgi:hypothetical protein
VGHRRLIEDNRFIPLHRARRPEVGEGFRTTPDARVLAERLERLLEALDRMLDDPIRIERAPSSHTVWVFEQIGYRVSRRTRGVHGLLKVDGRAVPQPWLLELARPLATSFFLREMLFGLGLSDFGRQLRLFPDYEELRAQEIWLANAAYALLRRDERFVRLRRSILPQALGLDPEIFSIALKARPLPWAGNLTATIFNRVWRQEAMFRRVARENPQLLPLVYVALVDKALDPKADPVRTLYCRVLEAGLGKAAWRYLAKHGTRFLRPAWEAAGDGSRLRTALEVLRVLEGAGLPPPPPASALRAIFPNWPADRRRRFRPGWCEVAGEVLGVALREADRVRASHEFDGYLQELRGVVRWARAERPALGKQQRRAGWRPLVRKALERERVESVCKFRGPESWDSAVGEFCTERYLVVPLDTSRALVEESLAMRNCAASMYGECLLDVTRLFSVRDRCSGKRLATIGLTVSSSPPWKVLDVRGPANRPAPRAIALLAEDLARMYVVAERCVSRTQDRKETVRNEPADGAREDGLAEPNLICCLPRLHAYADTPDNPRHEDTAGCLEP